MLLQGGVIGLIRLIRPIRPINRSYKADKPDKANNIFAVGNQLTAWRAAVIKLPPFGMDGVGFQ